MGFDGSCLNGKFLTEDLDLNLDKINDFLIVLRMARDSIVKGIANVVAQETSVEVTSKEAGIDILKELLFDNDSNRTPSNRFESLKEAMPKGTISEIKMKWLDRSICIDDLRLMSRKHLKVLMNEIKHLEYICTGGGEAYGMHDRCCLQKNLVKMHSNVDILKNILEAAYDQIGIHVYPQKELFSDHQWRCDIDKEVHNITVEHFIRDMQEEFCTKLCEKEQHYRNKRKCWLEKSKELSILREELDAFAVPTLDSEGTPEIHERRSVSRKDKPSHKVLASHMSACSQIHENEGTALDEIKKPLVEVVDMVKLKHMSKEELITYYMTEMATMSRQHESALHEKTEELFQLKRQLLREKGHLPFRKDKEFELWRNKFSNFTLKLDDLLEVDDNDRLPMVGGEDLTSNLRDQISVLLAENQQLRDSLVERDKEVMHLSAKISDASSRMSLHTLTEMKLLEQIRKLRQDLDDKDVETALHDEIFHVIVTKWVSSVINTFETLLTDFHVDHNIQLMVFKESIRYVISFVNVIQHRQEEKEGTLKGELLEKVEALHLEVMKSYKLQDMIKSLSTLVKEKETIAQDSMLALAQQKEKFEVSCQELDFLRTQREDREKLVLYKDQEIDMLKGRLEDANSQISHYEIRIQEFNGKLKVAQNGMQESEEKIMVLEDVIKKEKAKALSALKEKDVHMKSFVQYIVGVSRSLDEFEREMIAGIQRTDSRLEKLKHLCSLLPQQAHRLQTESSQYKRNLEIKLSNLQKAEDEVDVLGDEVDALLSTLAKVYITLDHYSDVLQHYPGVMEILRLVRMELEGSVMPFRKP